MDSLSQHRMKNAVEATSVINKFNQKNANSIEQTLWPE